MKSDESQVLELLSNHNVTFFIPPYQRNYEWDREQCEAFLNDVISTAQINSSGGDARHFFGSVTYFQDGATSKQGSYVRKKAYKLVLIDGQQRITTAMLFLAAVRDLTDDPEDKAFIDDNYLKNAADLTKDLCKYSTYYAYIVVEGAKTGIKKVDNKLADIRKIGVTTSYSFLLGLLSSWKERRLTDQDILILLDVLLVYFIRRRIIAQTGAENKNIPKLAQKIQDIEQAADKKAYLPPVGGSLRDHRPQKASCGLFFLRLHKEKANKSGLWAIYADKYPKRACNRFYAPV